MMIKKRICILLSLLLTVSCLSSCKGNNSDNDNIELVDPVGSSANYVEAAYRDINVCNVLSGYVVPHTTAVTFSTDQRFDKYGALPGTAVTKDTGIIYGSTKAIDEQIKAKKESISQAQEDYDEYIKEANAKLAEAKFDVEYYGKIVDNFEKMTDAEKASYGGKGYDAEYEHYKNRYADSVARFERWTQNIKEKTELFELDSAYKKKELSRLNKHRTEVLALAGVNGTVVGINFYDQDSYIQKNTAVAAVGDFDNLEIKTAHVYESEIKKAVDVYALVDGKRYEVSFRAITQEEKDSTDNLSDSSSTFVLEDPTKTVKAGDYATVVIVSQTKENTLCVPKSAIESDQEGKFVYVYDGENAVRVNVKVGVTSGLYTEVLSGISAGDKIISEFKISKGTKEASLVTGGVYSSFSASGYLFYSINEWITNPVEYGTTYIQEVLVKEYQRVEKGQVIATVKVTADDIAIGRKERTLLRANEDLNEMVKANGNKEDTKQIKLKREYINDLTEEINDMKKDATVTEIKAPYNGIITNVRHFEEGDLLFYDGKVAQISAEENCYIVVEDKNGSLSVGQEATIKYKSNNVSKEAQGHVVTVAPSSLPSGIETGYSLIQVSAEDLAEMSESNQGAGGWWMRTQFSVTVKARSVDNVVLVPKTAVKSEGGVNYVTVLDENGNPVYKEFVSGGSDSTNYWVIYGLSEGTKICLE